ncbi:LOW QUALITY PROTEIN: archaemetzincin-1 [Tachyglossus aculeatus]|uniref:LOW QUALITY PROTEIN: archaemetzincin-1 n=1 Tax=Tachyglossus aculeatus TaxID=9261 RepID=UPI0018F3CAFD|nr:LOW QUALITY PROTEIN: archaemetzincin-1 [Tachyglossus aculeatus]
MLQCRHAQEFSFGPRALKDALISTNPALQDLYAKAFSKTERLFLSEAYNPQRTLFCTLLIRTAFDWLLSHPDAPEDFETFYYSSLRRKQSVFRKHIYLQPIDLSEGPLGSSLLGCLRSCVESFFLGLHVKCLPSIPVSSIPCCFRHNRDSDRIQLHADGILTFLKNNKPMDALCVLGLTLIDLYPCEAWSFTFGKFLPGQEVGVCSFARFSGNFSQADPGTSEPAPGTKDVPEVTSRERDRTLQFGMVEMVQCCKVTCHEICHLMGLGNCRWLRCIMQGALSVDEALVRPLELCPICLRKLQYAVGFKLIERYKKLYEWLQTLATTWTGRESADLSVSEDNLPFSADSGMCCEIDSEAVTSLSEPLTPDASNHAFSMEPELEPEEGLSSLAELDSQQQLGGAAKSPEIIKEYELWLTACIAALERDVSEEELAQVDGEVDALARWEMFTGQLPATRKDLNFSRDSVGLRKVLGDKFSSLRRKLSTKKLSKAEPSPRGWGWEDH